MQRLPKPTPAELDLLRLLWRLGPATARQVHLEAQKERDLASATVLRTLQIMHAKGLVHRDESARSHVYRPAQAQGSLQKGLLGDLIRQVFGGSGGDLVLAALKEGHVTPEEREEIRAFLQDRGDRP